MANTDARALLLGMGATASTVLLMIPYLFMTPLTTDPDSAGVKEMIRLIQRGLTAAGVASLGADGVLGAKTATALNKVSPPFNSYAGKSWLTLLNDVSNAVKTKKFAKPAAPPPGTVSSGPLTAPLVDQWAFLKSPVVVGIGVFGGLYLLMGGKGKKRGRR